MSLQIRHISKKYAEKTILNDISLTIPKGKITSFIGPNGAGKSTLLAIISRLLQADSGEVRLDGSSISQIPNGEIAKRLSILKQSNHLDLRLTVEDLVAFGRFPYSKGRLTETDRDYIERSLDYMDLQKMRHVFINELSGGQRQRAYIAMTLAQDTDYILLDEPLNNLDMKHSVQIMQVLRKLCDELGKTVVIVIHDINFASCYSDYIVALKNGCLVQQGEVGQIMQTAALQQIYGMQIPIHTIDENKIAVFFKN
ncbi:ATP-binding cassette domain-containing protein [Testudinibacter sp. TR-2022]|uniref:iron ABC transporter ATP-binding protein n=1 Tax=Testudinibacter sp. TR-2022 TaxID=2585029 RepID=UPI001117BDE7|nr:ATP-binding cassette domain-containing protein [Testudinibacter sp. TR-2022]TNH03864.1 ATP-binding cassette domain-containing protein [Pasteurellaceae bacterium Phil31]TNH08672.1 ATP-binding cassette domain-containing protein [Testudinibacter sp. TR-2022]TNH08755.1 ATP-binding cassette domain-containing protein [Testudinibacter sp. TR-2022]TNH14839.1 ATP-binding cassette domain-containing protein [Testudinibacter sp. TR-2022]TNH18357.1 ATP-binding cassette domain-containing protein [Testudi